MLCYCLLLFNYFVTVVDSQRDDYILLGIAKSCDKAEEKGIVELLSK